MNFLFYQFYEDIFDYYLTAELYCALLKSSASSIGVTTKYFSDIQAAHEIDAIPNVYSTDGKIIDLTDRSISNNKFFLPELFWADPANLITNVYYAVVYDKDTDHLISKLDFQGAVGSSNGWFRIAFGLDGFINFLI